MRRWHSLPVEVYELVEQTPATVLLEGGAQSNSEGSEPPWTQLFTAPIRVCVAYKSAGIPELFETIESAVVAGHCAAGFFTYECGACFEPTATIRPSGAGAPLAWFGIYERSYVFDHATGAFVNGLPPELARLRKLAQEGSGASLRPSPTLTAEFSLTESNYVRRIADIHEWIRAGDVYQLNFTARFHIETCGSVAALYAQLHVRQPVRYGAFIHWKQGHHILSFSPELFFRVDRDGDTRRIVTCPMKGTAPRGRTTREDQDIAEWLRNDPKNRSENVMIVDLLRNDLGRIARFGSVRAQDLFAIERYPTLWQMTSTVVAELCTEVSFHDIFRALFPCGSITGAPKVRAMQLLAQLEDAPRGVYTGAIGLFSPRQTVFNVAIRTLELINGKGTFGAGSGVVIDSDPGAEFRECLLKAKFLTDPTHHNTAQTGQPGGFSLIETMLWNGTYLLLDLHLDRLADSANYFGFVCDRAAVRTALEQHACRFSCASSRKVRLLLDRDGNIQISDETIALASDADSIGRVRISSHRTDPSDPMLFHKTTHRPLYASEFADTARNGFDDVLFLNLHSEVTEGAISNVFIEKDGRWFTPPIQCGLLAGVYRRYLLESRSEIQEQTLTLDDLRTADAIYLTNAVRCLRRVEIDQ
jgi:para-aminobenzoate synthetase / 4-amino-4-deoxychorismate lyase